MVGPQVGQHLGDLGQRQNAPAQPILLAVTLPHAYQALGANDERLYAVVILKHAGQCGTNTRLAQAHHVTDQHAMAFVEVVGGDLNSACLELHEFAFEYLGDSKFGNTLARLPRQVVGHLQVHVVGRYGLLACPALFDDMGQIVRDVHAPEVGPAVIKPG